MKGRYTIVTTQPQALDRNHDGRVSAGELSSSALLGAGFVALGLGSVGLFGFTVLWGGSACLRLGLLITAIAGMVAGASGAWRLLYAFYELPHSWQSDDRRRAIAEAEYERSYREGLTDEVKDRITQGEMDAVVELLLSRYYAGKPWQRSKVNGVSDVKWNLANDTLKKCGLRRGRADKLEAESYEAAWAQYLRWRRSARSFKVGDDAELIAD